MHPLHIQFVILFRWNYRCNLWLLFCILVNITCHNVTSFNTSHILWLESCWAWWCSCSRSFVPGWFGCSVGTPCWSSNTSTRFGTTSLFWMLHNYLDMVYSDLFISSQLKFWTTHNSSFSWSLNCAKEVICIYTFTKKKTSQLPEL